MSAYVDGPIGAVKDHGAGGQGRVLRRAGTVATVVSVVVAILVGVLIVKGSGGPDAGTSEGEQATAESFVSQVNAGHHHQPGPEHASMMADVKVMAAYQDAYLETHPGQGAVPVARTGEPVTIGTHVFEPTAPNEITVLVPGEVKDLAPTVYCIVVANEAVGGPVAWDSAARGYADFTVMGGDPCGGAFDTSTGVTTP
ncbi:MAG: hypothetical protein WB473_11890 [Pedococcus sp.]